MKLRAVVDALVLDKVAKPYDMAVRDANGNETGEHRTGTTYSLCLKVEGDVPQNIKLDKEMALKFEMVEVGKVNGLVFEFETAPRAYNSKDTGKAQINFQDIPKVVDIIPFKK